MKRIIRNIVKALIVLGIADVMVRLWFWSQYDMDVFNMFSDLMNHGKDVQALYDATTAFVICTCLLVSTAMLWASTRLWRWVRRSPGHRSWALRRTSR